MLYSILVWINTRRIYVEINKNCFRKDEILDFGQTKCEKKDNMAHDEHLNLLKTQTINMVNKQPK